MWAVPKMPTARSLWTYARLHAGSPAFPGRSQNSRGVLVWQGRQGVDRGMRSDLDSRGAMWEQPPGCAACKTRVVTNGTA